MIFYIPIYLSGFTDAYLEDFEKIGVRKIINVEQVRQCSCLTNTIRVVNTIVREKP